LQRLYLLVTRQAQDRQDVARLLGIHRNTRGRWQARYAAGGLEALLATYIPTGTPVSLAPAVLASLEQALRRPAGFASDEARRQWGRQTPGVEVTDKTLYTLVRARVKAERKAARPRHTPQPRRRFPRSRLLVEHTSRR
jgi:transposase